MKVLIVGATGATGKDVLTLLLADDTVKEVAVFVRRDFSVKHPKLTTHIIDFDRPNEWTKLVTGDVLISSLGTTLKAAGSKDARWKIDYDYQYQFAKAAKENKVNTYVLVSSASSSSKSPFFYAKMKGQLEDAVQLLNFNSLIIFRPPLLVRENSDRKAEVLGAKVLKFLNHFGILKSQKPITTMLLAEAMLQSLKNLAGGTHILEGQTIRKSIQK